MATKEEVTKLAALARIHVPEQELSKCIQEFDAILGYISQLEALELPRGDASGRGQTEAEKPPLRNVMREDGEPHATGIHTEKIAAQFPARDGNALSVKQIITHE